MAYCSRKNGLYSIAIWVLMWNERTPWARQERGWRWGGNTPTRLPAYTDTASNSLWRFALHCIEAGNHKAKLVAFRSVSRISRQNRQCKPWTRVKTQCQSAYHRSGRAGQAEKMACCRGILQKGNSGARLLGQRRRLGSVGEATACNCVLLWRLRCRIASLLQIFDDIWRCCNLPRLSMLRVVFDLAKECQLLQLSGETKEMMRTKRR